MAKRIPGFSNKQRAIVKRIVTDLPPKMTDIMSTAIASFLAKQNGLKIKGADARVRKHINNMRLNDLTEFRKKIHEEYFTSGSSLTLNGSIITPSTKRQIVGIVTQMIDGRIREIQKGKNSRQPIETKPVKVQYIEPKSEIRRAIEGLQKISPQNLPQAVRDITSRNKFETAEDVVAFLRTVHKIDPSYPIQFVRALIAEKRPLTRAEDEILK